MEKFVKTEASWQHFTDHHFSHALFSSCPGPQAPCLGNTFNIYYQHAALKLIVMWCN